MTKKAIQTDLLGTEVQMTTEFHTGKLGKIRNVFLDKEGDPRYTVEFPDGELYDCYSCRFKIIII